MAHGHTVVTLVLALMPFPQISQGRSQAHVTHQIRQHLRSRPEVCSLYEAHIQTSLLHGSHHFFSVAGPDQFVDVGAVAIHLPSTTPFAGRPQVGTADDLAGERARRRVQMEVY
jgi:hypothetical protein